MATLTIYHNPRCSKSRQTLELLTNANAEVEIIEYLKTPPSVEQVKTILSILDIEPRALIRTKEAEYKEQNLNNKDLTDTQLIAAMVATPKLIERPIVVKGNQACIGRPPENVLALL
ncbi:arsenate reductase (glutaredoxin) [Thalassomonas sp. M1454]|uniref:arsenate reductase (glutaredoxin) n=1 Tax=Thalassomonas sp. M1454 TaxID=2594477 RepID=UPI001180EE80|nr:arsenate reductase (glutaredoxin) [Thalassomonas sp. M1454]TRX56992.1 arsenate reductase (glutaredoxin) [Thalassomonas sp. M1454]